MCVLRIIAMIRYISLRYAKSVRKLIFCTFLGTVSEYLGYAELDSVYLRQISGRPDTFAFADLKGSDVLSVHE